MSTYLYHVRKADHLIEFISKIIDKGARIDLLGLQGHMGYLPRFFTLPTDDEMNSFFDLIYSKLKLPISITEVD